MTCDDPLALESQLSELPGAVKGRVIRSSMQSAMHACVGWLHPATYGRVRQHLGKSSLSLARRGLQRRYKLSYRMRAAGQENQKTPIESRGTRGRIWLPNQHSTYELGRLLASDTRPGDVVLLHGELGAGKTSVARGYIHAARRDESIEVTSPTYLLTNVYTSELKDSTSQAPDIFHMDLWRLESALDRPLVDFNRVFTDCISLIEWPDRLKDLTPPDRLDVRLQYPPPLQQTDEQDESDLWGFGDGEPDDANSSRSGRFVSFDAHGHSWRERIARLLSVTSYNEEGHRILPHS